METKAEEKVLTKLKAWFCYAGKPGWYSCTMVLENGWAPFGHICSHPNFAPGDLFYGRPERMAIFKEMGIEIDAQPVCEDKELPPELLQKNKEGVGYEHLSKQYEKLAEEHRPAPGEKS